jgi:hypothetical protein
MSLNNRIRNLIMCRCGCICWCPHHYNSICVSSSMQVQPNVQLRLASGAGHQRGWDDLFVLYMTQNSAWAWQLHKKENKKERNAVSLSFLETSPLITHAFNPSHIQRRKRIKLACLHHTSLITSFFYSKSQSATTGRSYMSPSVSADTNGESCSPLFTKLLTRLLPKAGWPRLRPPNPAHPKRYSIL